MYIPDYDKALYYTLWGQWDDLLVLMVRTNDDLLSKRIEVFLHAFHYHAKEQEVMNSHEELLRYIDHAMGQTPAAAMMEV
ncbi:YhdB family protein [Aquibacillus koreensis]|uniref:YhdB family protein n=1 Tax=Aquibacillus koreensis TaxID=279446 RepID=A0A9X3WL10_9BACI|nr:YhdB family protein [Aquibacillus koreensis]MCT2535775.1 YhdB family protein [Aquibacillus koreensis]MDC3420231.1 YhdB family protein [Aquibacillus koreensis]